MKISIGALFFLSTSTTNVQAATGGNLSECGSKNGGCQLGEYCVGNPFLKEVEDSGEYGCNKCNGSRDFWPCNFETLCYCNSPDNPKIPPAPKSGETVNTQLDACRDVLTEDIFNSIVQPTSEEGKKLFTYSGLCDAISNYNEYHDEKFAQMGSVTQIRQELSAFLAHAAVETNNFSDVREEHHCVNPITDTLGNTYCMPCKEQFYNKETKTCTQPYFADKQSYFEYCDLSRQGNQGCSCTVNGVKMADVPLLNDSNGPAVGYVLANDMYFSRGAFANSWNYDYMGVGISIKGDPQFFCEQPDLLSTTPQYAWQAGIYKWMEYMPYEFGSTAHKQALKGNYGGTIDILHGPLECPSSINISEKHMKMVRDRVSQICSTGSALGVMLEWNKCENPYDSDCQKCDGLEEVVFSCQQDGSCPACNDWADNLVSLAPTVTPATVKPPTFEEWGKYWGGTEPTRNGAKNLRYSLAALPASFVFVAYLI